MHDFAAKYIILKIECKAYIAETGRLGTKIEKGREST